MQTLLCLLIASFWLDVRIRQVFLKLAHNRFFALHQESYVHASVLDHAMLLWWCMQLVWYSILWVVSPKWITKGHYPFSSLFAAYPDVMVTDLRGV